MEVICPCGCNHQFIVDISGLKSPTKSPKSPKAEYSEEEEELLIEFKKVMLEVGTNYTKLSAVWKRHNSGKPSNVLLIKLYI
jgi:hypothetical protein